MFSAAGQNSEFGNSIVLVESLGLGFQACECLTKDGEVLFHLLRFPAKPCIHLRTTNPIESTFATVRHRTRQTKGCGSVKATMAMVYKLALEAEKTWVRLHSYRLIPLVIEGVTFHDGELKPAA